MEKSRIEPLILRKKSNVDLIIVMLVGASNAVNLTDGLDGLLAGTAAIAFGAFAVITWSADQVNISVFSAAVFGAVIRAYESSTIYRCRLKRGSSS